MVVEMFRTSGRILLNAHRTRSLQAILNLGIGVHVVSINTISPICIAVLLVSLPGAQRVEGPGHNGRVVPVIIWIEESRKLPCRIRWV